MPSNHTPGRPLLFILMPHALLYSHCVDTAPGLRLTHISSYCHCVDTAPGLSLPPSARTLTVWTPGLRLPQSARTLTAWTLNLGSACLRQLVLSLRGHLGSDCLHQLVLWTHSVYTHVCDMTYCQCDHWQPKGRQNVGPPTSVSAI